MTTIAMRGTDLDPFSDEALVDPWAIYRELRDIGPVVRLERYGLSAVMRYEDVRTVLADWETYSSMAVGLNAAFNDMAGPKASTNILMASPPDHHKLRAIL